MAIFNIALATPHFHLANASKAGGVEPLLSRVLHEAFPEAASQEWSGEVVGGAILFAQCVWRNPSDEIWCAREESFRIFKLYNSLEVLTYSRELSEFYLRFSWKLNELAEYLSNGFDIKPLRLFLTDFKYEASLVDVRLDKEGRRIGVPTPSARFAAVVVQLIEESSCTSHLTTGI